MVCFRRNEWAAACLQHRHLSATRAFTLQCRYITLGWVMAEVQTLPLTSSTAICCAASLSRAEASTNCRFRSLQMVRAGGRWQVR